MVSTAEAKVKTVGTTVRARGGVDSGGRLPSGRTHRRLENSTRTVTGSPVTAARAGGGRCLWALPVHPEHLLFPRLRDPPGGMVGDVELDGPPIAVQLVVEGRGIPAQCDLALGGPEDGRQPPM